MKRKKLYTALFISFFLLSTVAMFAQPAAGATFTFAVPDQAKGMTLYNEVKVYDKDAWGDHLGYDQDNTANAYFAKDGTGANDVGAQSKYKVLDWERTDIQYIDHQLSTLQPPSKRAAYYDGYASYSYIEKTVRGMADPTAGSALVGILMQRVEVVRQTPVIGGNITAQISGAINATAYLLTLSTLTTAEILTFFGKTYEGYELERDLWWYTRDFDSSPDEEPHIVPYIENPHDIWDTYLNLNLLYETQIGIIQTIRDTYASFMNYANWSVALGGTQTAGDGSAWDHINNYVKAYLGAIPPFAQLLALINAPIGPPFNGFGGDAVYAFYYLNDITGLAPIQASLLASMRNKKEYLAAILRAGLPAHAPVDKWWEKVIDDFNIDEDTVWVNLQGDANQGGVYVDGKTVVIEYEWYNVQDWHGIKYEDRDDYEERYTYGDTGGQSMVEFTDGDEVFYKIEALSPAIPGYEITIFLAAAAISALGLIYVVMKKRRK